MLETAVRKAGRCGDIGGVAEFELDVVFVWRDDAPMLEPLELLRLAGALKYA